MKRRLKQEFAHGYILEKIVEYHFPTIKLDAAGPLVIRIEILRNLDRKKQFLARVSRLEINRLQPTFPQVRGKPKRAFSDETFWVQDHFLWLPNVSIFSKSVDAALLHVFNKIVEKLS